MSPDIEKGVAEVCNLSAGLVAQGIEQGIEQGIVRGIEQGKADFLRQLMQRNHLSAMQAMDMVGIPEEERSRYQELLEQ